MFKNYFLKTQENQTKTLIDTLTSNQQIVILSIEICGSDTQSGYIQFIKQQNNQQLFVQKISVNQNQNIIFDHKILIPSTYSYKVYSDISNIQICVNAVSQSVN